MDEKWSFAHTKEARCDPDKLESSGDNWDHTAIDAEHRLVLDLVPGKRATENCEKLVASVKSQTEGRHDILFTSDEHASYASVLEKVYGQDAPSPKRLGPGRPKKPRKIMPLEMCYATARKTRKSGRVVEVVRAIVFGTLAYLDLYLSRSKVSANNNTSFVERNNGADRGQNARKRRKTYCFSKDWELHNAASYFIAFSYNFCWIARAISILGDDGARLKRTPAMAAKLSDHFWTTAEWITYPARAS